MSLPEALPNGRLMTSRPALVVVGGPPGSGEATLAHEVARAVGCPAACRDEIREGMVRAAPGLVPGPGDDRAMTWRCGRCRLSSACRNCSWQPA